MVTKGCLIMCISKTVNEIIGKPFQLRTSGPHAFDCRGVVVYLTKEFFGVDLPDIFDGSVRERVEAFAAHYIQLPNIALAEFGDVIHMGELKGVADEHIAFVERQGHVVTANAQMDVHRASFENYKHYPMFNAYRLKSRC